MQKFKSTATVMLLLLITGLLYFQSWFGPVKNWGQIKTLELYSQTTNAGWVADTRTYINNSSPVANKTSANIANIEFTGFAPSSYSPIYQKLIFKLGQWTGNPQFAVNLFDLLGYLVIALISFIVFQKLKVQKWLAFSISLLFTFTFYHQMQGTSLIMGWYFSIPIYFYMAFMLFSLVKKDLQTGRYKENLNNKEVVALFLIAGLFPWLGVAYFVIGSVMIVATGLIVLCVMQKHRQQLFFVLLSYTIIGLISAHNAIELNQQVLGVNHLPSIAEVEQNSFKFNTLLLPNPFHRIPSWSSITDQYIGLFPLNQQNILSLLPVNADNAIVSLGVLGSIGFFIILIAGIFALFRRVEPAHQAQDNQWSQTLEQSLPLLLVLLLVGGFGTISTLLALVSDNFAIEWYRTSPFICFLVLLVLAISLQHILAYFSSSVSQKLTVVLALVLVFFGLFDQVPSHCGDCRNDKEKQWREHQTFFKQEVFNTTSATDWLQLPRTPLDAISKVSNNYLYTDNVMQDVLGHAALANDALAWKRLYDLLPTFKLQDQIIIAKYLGFKGLVINKNNWCDWKTAKPELEQTLQAMPSTSVVRKQVSETKGLTAYLMQDQLSETQVIRAKEILLQHAFQFNGNNLSNNFDIQSVIDFKNQKFPSFLKSTQGLIGESNKVQGFGVNQNQCVTTSKELQKSTPAVDIQLAEMYVSPLKPNALSMKLYTTLPQVFKLHIDVKPLVASYRGKVQQERVPLKIKVGKQTHLIYLNYEATELVFDFDQAANQKASVIEIFSNQPFVSAAKTTTNNNLDNVVVLNYIQIETIKP